MNRKTKITFPRRFQKVWQKRNSKLNQGGHLQCAVERSSGNICLWCSSFLHWHGMRCVHWVCWWFACFVFLLIYPKVVFFCLPLSIQPRLNTQQQWHAPPVWRPRTPVVVCWALTEYSMANRKIAYTLGRRWAHIFDRSSTSGYVGAKYFQLVGPRFLTCLQARK